MSKEPLYEGTITITRSIQVFEDGHNWTDEIESQGLPKSEFINLVECDLLDLNESVTEHIYQLEDD